MHTPEQIAQSFIADHPKLRLCFAARDLADLAAALSAYGAACAAQEREAQIALIESWIARYAATADHTDEGGDGQYHAALCFQLNRLIAALRALPPVLPTAPTE